ncbi:MAG: thioredoxin [Deltaproteobacteria bacterium]|nr:thioredoxin [Deltaproteobacteria bacterium]
MATVSEITDDNFQNKLSSSSKLYLLDFWAEWCGPCKALNPVIETLAEEMAEVLEIGKVNTEANIQVASEYGVRQLPTLILFKQGMPVDQLTGGVSKDRIIAMVEKHK